MPDIYKLIPYDYAAIRKPEYDRLLDLYMSKAKASKQPVFVQVSGIPGAGKSTFCAHNKWNKDKLFISFDAIMNSLPAYQLDSYRLVCLALTLHRLSYLDFLQLLGVFG